MYLQKEVKVRGKGAVEEGTRRKMVVVVLGFETRMPGCQTHLQVIPHRQVSGNHICPS